MKNTFILIIVAVLFHSQLAAQEYKKYQWEEFPEISVITGADVTYPAVVIKNFKLIEHELRGSLTQTFTTVHKIIHINSDAGIEKYNKIYIPMQAGYELVDLKVRSVNSEGKVTLIKRENIKELKNVEGFRNVKIFAIEGLEVGGEAEYLYTVKSRFEPFGREVVQQDIPVKNVEITLFHPIRWTFKCKSYNGLPEARREIVSEKKHMIYLEAKDLRAFHEEEYAYYKPKLMRFEYKIVYNGYQSDLFSWKFLSEKMVSSLSTRKGSKTGYKFVKDILNSGSSAEAQIRSLENKIKSTIRLDKGSGAALSDPTMIIKNGVGNSRGISKLFIYCLAELQIPNILVFACNRYEGELDEAFANPSDISDLLIYFPQFGKYLMPDAYHMRYGVTHTGLLHTKALFVPYTVRYDQLNSSKYFFQTIDGLDAELNHMGVIASIDLSENLSLPVIKIENYAQGYRGFAFRSGYHYADKSRQEEFIKDVTLSSYENFDIKNIQVEGHDISLSAYPEKYFRINMEYTTPELVERAGNEYLLAVGKIIGEQSELYQEKERQHDIAFHSISNYHHEITLDIPEGYVLEGLESIKINNKVQIGDKDVMYFISDYKQTSTSLTITVDEVYSVLNLPKAQYDDFRTVINSAANFNKLTLVLRKE